MRQILIIEDDIALNNGIVFSLKQENYSFVQAFTIKEEKEFIAKETFDLIILDVNLPDGNGFDLCREIRKTNTTPIIFLTVNDMEVDVVTGLELGADDYITKPFSLAVLRARVSALLRRIGQNDKINSVVIDDFTFDFDSMEFYKGKRLIELSKTEQKLLKLLIFNRGKVLTRSMLIDKIWSDGSEYVDENALSVTIKRLRDKLEDTPSKPKYIQTVYGIGYTWVVEYE